MAFLEFTHAEEQWAYCPLFVFACSAKNTYNKAIISCGLVYVF
jgi:hypothetical protein